MWPLAVHVSIQDSMGLKPLLSSSMLPTNTLRTEASVCPAPI